MSVSLAQIAEHLSPGGWSVSGGDYETLVASSGQTKPTLQALEAARADVEAMVQASKDAAAIAGTYLVQPEGFRLATGATDQAAFANLLVLLREAGAPPPSEIVIRDYLGQPHTVTLERFRAIMLDYGMAIYAAHAQS